MSWSLLKGWYIDLYLVWTILINWTNQDDRENLRAEYMILERGEDISPSILQKFHPIVKSIGSYHNHKVIGLEHIPEQGRAIIAFNHSLATYDIALLFLEIYDRLGRIARPLVDHLFFRVPFLGEIIEEIGCVDGFHNNAKKLLQHEELIGVAPGGMREALRPSSERYQILWEKRKGFIRLSIETESPVIVAVCPKADDLYHVYNSRLTSWAYERFKVPLFIAKGRAFTPLPRRVKLTHFLSEAMIPPKPKSDPVALKRQIDRFHRKVLQRTWDLIAEAIDLEG